MIDHSFAIRGVGTVCTGTVVAGSVSVGDEVFFPRFRRSCKVKSIQSFKEQVTGITAGDRDHFGIVKGLFDNGVLPHVLSSGTSAGAVVGAFVGTRTNEEIERDLTAEMLEVKLRLQMGD